MLKTKFTFPSLGKSSSTLAKKTKKMTFSWPSLPSVIPYRVRRRLRSRLRAGVSPASSLASLNTSFSLNDTLKSLRQHRWTKWDLQYVVLAGFLLFSAWLMNVPVLLKALVGVALVTALSLPITRQFFLPLLPVITWLVFFAGSGSLPTSWRAPIWVTALPTAENAIFGTSLSAVLSAHKSVFLDVLAWLPYGIIHYAAPFLVAAPLFIFGAPGTLPAFAKAFGYMNLTAVVIQLCFPCTPPWYEEQYGLKPAHYGMGGNPAGLARIDQLFGIDMYTTTFINQPVPFGAFPSLHAGFATMEALFMGHVFPKARILFFMHVCWIWWSTMYLSHHYAVDLIGGSTLALSIFFFVRRKWLVRSQPGKTFRWDYDYTEIGTDETVEFGLGHVRGHHKYSEEDDWTLGSSSSFSSGSMSPSDENQSLWEGETLASHSDSDNAIEVVVG